MRSKGKPFCNELVIVTNETPFSELWDEVVRG